MDDRVVLRHTTLARFDEPDPPTARPVGGSTASGAYVVRSRPRMKPPEAGTGQVRPDRDGAAKNEPRLAKPNDGTVGPPAT